MASTEISVEFSSDFRTGGQSWSHQTAEICYTGVDKQMVASSAVFPAFLLVQNISCVSLNFIILVTLSCNKRLQSSPNKLVSCLAASDMFYSLAFSIRFGLIVYNSSRGQEYSGVESLEKIFVFMVSFSLLCNFFSHTLITVDRWLYIARPYVHQRMITSRVTVCSAVTIWVIACLCSVNVLTEDMKMNPCTAHFGLIIPCLHFVTSIILCVLYAHITMITRRQVRAIQRTRIGSVANDESLASWKRKWKNVRMFVIVYGTFFVLLTPMAVIAIYAYVDPSQVTAKMFGIVTVLAVLHYCSNFFVYVSQDKDFKLALKRYLKTIGCFACPARVQPSINVSGQDNTS